MIFLHQIHSNCLYMIVIIIVLSVLASLSASMLFSQVYCLNEALFNKFKICYKNKLIRLIFPENYNSLLTEGDASSSMITHIHLENSMLHSSKNWTEPACSTDLTVCWSYPHSKTEKVNHLSKLFNRSNLH